MYTTSKKLLEDALSGGYAVGAFNFENLEMAMAIIAAAERCRSPLIMQTTPSTVAYAGASAYAATVRALAEAASVPVALHLDHGSSFELCAEAARVGYSSLMIDGSKLSLEENIALTRSVVENIAKDARIPVEGELGSVGGKEDSHEADAIYTDPHDALRFVRETGVSSLAVAIGTAHGIYAAEPKLDTERLSSIVSLLRESGCMVPIVLHGASGLSDGAVKECISRGVCKVNFATELRQAYTAAVRASLSSDPKLYDPKKYGRVAMAALYEAVEARIRVCGSVNKA